MNSATYTFRYQRHQGYDRKGEGEKNIANVRRAIVITEHCKNVHMVMAMMFSCGNHVNKTRR